MKNLVDIYYPNSEVITVVMDNLNTHSPASLYKAFEPTEARRILNKLSSNIVPDNSLGAESSQVDENFQGLPPGFSRTSKLLVERKEGLIYFTAFGNSTLVKEEERIFSVQTQKYRIF